MQAALFSGPRKLEIIDYNNPPISHNELLVKVGACGVCGTDFHIFNGEAPAKAPVIIGHEYAGEVLEIGKDVSGFKPGDHVAINPNIHCGYCDYCKDGRINLCKNLRALGVTLNGGFAQVSVVPQSQAYFIPKDFPIEQAAFSEPLSCCLHGAELADIKFSNTVAIIGAGTIGLLMLQLAKLKGAKKIIVVETVPDKQAIAYGLGADYTINPLDKDFLSKFSEAFSEGVDIVIECAGKQTAAECALDIVRKGGRIIIFGLAGPVAKLDLPLQKFFHKELTIKSSLLNPNTFQTAVDLLVSKKINVRPIKQHFVSLDNNSIQSLFSGLKDDSVIKYIIKPN